MQCRNCGIEIADKALICYKCGTATVEAKHKAPAVKPPRSSAGTLISLLALVLLVIFALYMDRFLTVGAPRGMRWVIVGVAVAIVALRAIARRRS